LVPSLFILISAQDKVLQLYLTSYNLNIQNYTFLQSFLLLHISLVTLVTCSCRLCYHIFPSILGSLTGILKCFPIWCAKTYLREYEFIVETDSACETGDPGVLFAEKTEGRKSRETVPLIRRLILCKILKLKHYICGSDSATLLFPLFCRFPSSLIALHPILFFASPPPFPTSYILTLYTRTHFSPELIK
jgi:hypothetical protein